MELFFSSDVHRSICGYREIKWDFHYNENIPKGRRKLNYCIVSFRNGFLRICLHTYFVSASITITLHVLLLLCFDYQDDFQHQQQCQQLLRNNQSCINKASKVSVSQWVMSIGLGNQTSQWVTWPGNDRTWVW